jgi:membrane-associated phospholipid phosphatase
MVCAKNIFISFILLVNHFASSQFYLDLKRETGILAGNIILHTIPLAFKPETKILNQDILNSLNPQDINALDRGAIHNYNRELSKFSDATIAGLASLSSVFILSNKELRKDWLVYSVMFAETMATSIGITNLSKTYIARLRPHVYNTVSTLDQKKDWAPYKSFFSGHACQSFAMAGYLTSILPKNKAKNFIVIGAYSIATGIAILRYESGAHFPTDLLTGAAVGTTIGYLIPMFHKQNNSIINYSIFNPNSNTFGLTLTYRLN